MGNSEVGHLNLGAGRIVYQSLTRISKSIREGEFFQIPVLTTLMEAVKSQGGRLHVMGLCSEGGVHSHVDHLYACLELAKRHGIREVYIHCFTDGRDTSPTSGVETIAQIESHARTIGVGTIATIVGRYYAMDRDKRWDRVAKAYNAPRARRGNCAQRCRRRRAALVRRRKDRRIHSPHDHSQAGRRSQRALIRDGDGMLFFNFRADRARELTEAFMQDGFTGFERKKQPKVAYVCMTEYKDTFGLPIVFPPEPLTNILGTVLAAHGLKQLRIAETEKYAHVTFFFNGGVEEPNPGEDRALIPSPKVATYDLAPEMSAGRHGRTRPAVGNESIRRGDLQLRQPRHGGPHRHHPRGDAHRGNGRRVRRPRARNDQEAGRRGRRHRRPRQCRKTPRRKRPHPFTSHTTFPVEIFYVGDDHAEWRMHSGILADIAPTMLQLLGLKQPPEMTGHSLLEKR